MRGDQKLHDRRLDLGGCGGEERGWERITSMIVSSYDRGGLGAVG